MSSLGHDQESTNDLWASVWSEPHYKNEPIARYRGDIPMPVLLTIEKFKERFGERVKFFVAWTDNDPFLGVTVDNCGINFIERWDEPSFRS